MKKIPPIVCPKCQILLDESLFERKGTEVCSNCNFEIKQLQSKLEERQRAEEEQKRRQQEVEEQAKKEAKQKAREERER